MAPARRRSWREGLLVLWTCFWTGPCAASLDNRRPLAPHRHFSLPVLPCTRHPLGRPSEGLPSVRTLPSPSPESPTPRTEPQQCVRPTRPRTAS